MIENFAETKEIIIFVVSIRKEETQKLKITLTKRKINHLLL